MRPNAGVAPIAESSNAGSPSVAFTVDRLGDAAAGRVEVVGTWTGVRGRRFVRPELILHDETGAERRVLAELDEKPWPAEDGAPWRATFRLRGVLADAGALELSVAPDIVVPLRGTPPPRTPTRARRTLLHRTGADAGASAVTSPPPPAAPPPRESVPPRPGAAPASAASRAPELARLTTRLQHTESGLEHERELRGEAERRLEHEREEARTLRAEIARLEAEVALARVAQREAHTTGELLDAARRAARAADARADGLTAELRDAERDRDTLRAQLAARVEELDRAQSQHRAEPRAGASRFSEPAVAEFAHRGHEHLPEPGVAHSDRPLNPSLRGSRWLPRLVALVVVVAVLVVVYVILTSTILH